MWMYQIIYISQLESDLNQSTGTRLKLSNNPKSFYISISGIKKSQPNQKLNGYEKNIYIYI